LQAYRAWQLVNASAQMLRFFTAHSRDPRA
jgi:hypothetical protein